MDFSPCKIFTFLLFQALLNPNSHHHGRLFAKCHQIPSLRDKFSRLCKFFHNKKFKLNCSYVHAVVVTRVASSLEAGGLPGYPISSLVEINVMKS
jgi:hypothetical protein